MATAASIRNDVFLGGTFPNFERHGRNQFIKLISHGLNPDSRLLDFGCGCLRGGYWTMRFLDPGLYYGIEPNEKMLNAGKQSIIGERLLEEKEPTFCCDDQFEFTVFGNMKFDFVMAGSIWTHSPKWAIEKMLQQFSMVKENNGVMLASFIRTENPAHDYHGSCWVGKSHQSEKAGLVKHSLQTLQSYAFAYGLVITHLDPRRMDCISWVKIHSDGI